MNSLKLISILILTLYSTKLFAADPKIPTVDDVNREIPKVKKDLKKNEMPSDAIIDKDKKKVDQVKEEDVTKVFVKSFIIRGNKKYPTEIFEAMVKDKVNKELGYADLRNIINEMSFYYRSKGYLATAFLPEQNVSDGDILIYISEGRIGKVEIKADAKKVLNISMFGFIFFAESK